MKKRKALQRTQRPDAQEASNREEARACPSPGLVEDCQREGHRHQGLPIVDVPIALPPNRPSDQPYEGIETFTPGFRDHLALRDMIMVSVSVCRANHVQYRGNVSFGHNHHIGSMACMYTGVNSSRLNDCSLASFLKETPCLTLSSNTT
jgi:hypothetical protein